MSRLNSKSAAKLQMILSKKVGRLLTPDELEQAYSSLMDFVFALVELTPLETEVRFPKRMLTSTNIFQKSIVIPNQTIV